MSPFSLSVLKDTVRKLSREDEKSSRNSLGKISIPAPPSFGMNWGDRTYKAISEWRMKDYEALDRY